MKKRKKLKPDVRAVLRFRPYRAKRPRRQCTGGKCGYQPKTEPVAVEPPKPAEE